MVGMEYDKDDYQSVERSLRAAIDKAIEDQRVDPVLDGGAIATVFRLAVAVDYLVTHDGLNAEGKFDNVSVPTLLRYLTALGLTPQGRKELNAQITKKVNPTSDDDQPSGKQPTGLGQLQLVANKTRRA